MTIPTPPARAFRGDIDGLRAVAIVLVVLFHAELRGFSGGFVGVDVFFVISGYLITRNLLSETATTGRVGLLGFWAKRIRRLVPALALMIFVVLVIAHFVLGVIDWHIAADQGRAAALYVSNIVFAREASDYFGADLDSSLFQHTWSLGVEEQFYLLWPLLVAAAAWFARRARLPLRPTLAAGFAVTFLASLAWCVRLSSQGSPDAFYLLPSRAWEFAAAGLLAMLTLPRWFGRRSVVVVTSLVGLGLLVAADLLITGSTLYPGLWALLPVGATLLLIAAGDLTADRDRANPVTRLLSTAPAQWLGRVSYSWYLWHWPLMLLLESSLGHGRTWIRLTGVLLALPVAVLAHALVEDRVRFSTRLIGSRRLTYVVGVVVTVTVVLVTVGIDRWSTGRINDIASAASAGAGDQDRLPSDDLEAVRASRDTVVCARSATTADGIAYCENGDPNGDRTVMLIGDSHAAHWATAFSAAAREEGLRLVVRSQGRCPSVPVRVSLKASRAEDEGCREFREETDRLIAALAPTAIVISNSASWESAMLDGDGGTRAALWGEAYGSLLRSWRSSGIHVGAVVDSPEMRIDPVACAADHGVALPCATPRKQAFETKVDFAAAEAAAREALGGVPTLDITDVLCSPEICPIVLDGTYVYVDRSHLYDRFTLTQLPAVRDLLHALTAP